MSFAMTRGFSLMSTVCREIMFILIVRVYTALPLLFSGEIMDAGCCRVY